MKRMFATVSLAVLATLSLPATLRAQGIGGVIDFINRLSGPRMVGVAGSYFFNPGPTVRGRISAGYLTSVASNDVIDPDGSKVNMISFKPAVELSVAGPVEAGVGFSLHRFGGDIDEAFWHWSVPAYLQARVPVVRRSGDPWVLLRLGAGAEYFPEFSPTDFDPLSTGVSTDGGEFTFAAFLGLDLRVGGVR